MAILAAAVATAVAFVACCPLPVLRLLLITLFDKHRLRFVLALFVAPARAHLSKFRFVAAVVAPVVAAAVAVVALLLFVLVLNHCVSMNAFLLLSVAGGAVVVGCVVC